MCVLPEWDRLGHVEEFVRCVPYLAIQRLTSQGRLWRIEHSLSTRDFTESMLKPCMPTASVAQQRMKPKMQWQTSSLLHGGASRSCQKVMVLCRGSTPWPRTSSLTNSDPQGGGKGFFVKAVSDFEAAVPGPEAQIVRRSEHEAVVSALGRLPERDREMILLVEWEGLSREKVAEMMYLSRSAIDKRMSRAYERLAKSLDARSQDVRTPPVKLEEGGEA